MSEVPAELPDPICMHCATSVTPCLCWRGRGCELNGWKHIRSGEHQCPGMGTGAYPSSASLRALLTGTHVDVAIFREAMGAWFADSVSDEALERGILAIAPRIAAAGRAAERERWIDAIGSEAVNLLHYAGWYDEDDRAIAPMLHRLADLLRQDGDTDGA